MFPYGHPYGGNPHGHRGGNPYGNPYAGNPYMQQLAMQHPAMVRGGGGMPGGGMPGYSPMAMGMGGPQQSPYAQQGNPYSNHGQGQQDYYGHGGGQQDPYSNQDPYSDQDQQRGRQPGPAPPSRPMRTESDERDRTARDAIIKARDDARPSRESWERMNRRREARYQGPLDYPLSTAEARRAAIERMQGGGAGGGQGGFGERMPPSYPGGYGRY